VKKILVEALAVWIGQLNAEHRWSYWKKWAKEIGQHTGFAGFT